MTKATYKAFNLVAHGSIEVESINIIVSDMAAGRQAWQPLGQ